MTNKEKHIKPFDFTQTSKTGEKLWKRVTENPGPGQISYVFPINDKEPHGIKDKYCKCCPKIIWERDYSIIIHEAFDKR